MSSEKTDYFSQLSYIMIETNSSCNLKCTFCNREDLKAKGFREPKNVTLEEFKSMLDIFKDCPIDTVKLEGISEPMLHPQFDQMAKLVKEYFPKSFMIIATNLQYNLEKVPFVQTLPYVDMVYLSIDGTHEIYEKVRPPSKWDKLIDSLEKIDQLVPSEIRKKKLFINFTVTQDNVDTLDDIYQIKDKYGLADVRINLAQNWNEDEENFHDYNENFLAKVRKFIKDVKGVPGWNYKDCFWPFNGIIVDVFGNVRQCIINTSQKPISNIFDKNFKDFYNNSIHYTHVRNQLGQDLPHAACRSCDYKFLSPVLEKLFEGNQQKLKPRDKIVIPNNKIIQYQDGSSSAFFQKPAEDDDKRIWKCSSYGASTIKYQYEWLKKIQPLGITPAVYKFEEIPGGSYYEMDHYPLHKTLFEYSQGDPKGSLEHFKTSLQYLNKIHQTDTEIKNDPTYYLNKKIISKIEESTKASNILKKLFSYDSVTINGVEYKGVSQIINFCKNQIQEIFSETDHSFIHGDFTLENILVTDSEKVVIIDPVGSNGINSKILDYAKLGQSIDCNYELLKRSNSSHDGSSTINYTIDGDKIPSSITAYLKENVIEKLTDLETVQYHFHLATHFLRMLPYRIVENRKTIHLFYSQMIIHFNKAMELMS